MKPSLLKRKKKTCHSGQRGGEIFYRYANAKREQKGVAEVEFEIISNH